MTQDAMSQSHASFTKPTLLASLPPSALPKPHGGPESPRLIVIGDVHGQSSALDELLAKVGYSRARGDVVIFTGDMVNKGPDSGGVVDRAVAMGAYSVRGNHEDRVLRAWDEMQAKDSLDTESETDTDIDEEEIEGGGGGGVETESKKKHKNKHKNKHKHKHHKSKKGDRKTAKSLTPAQRSWLAARPVILRLGNVSPYYGDVVVVHGGLVPGVPLEKQDPQVVMNIRTIITPSSSPSSSPPSSLLDPPNSSSADPLSHPHLEPSEGREGRPWSKVWNALEKEKQKQKRRARPGGPAAEPPTTVVYGHDAKTGLSVRRYAFGVDTNCARGGELTALVFEATGSSAEEGDASVGSNGDEGEGEGEGDAELAAARHGIKHRLVSISCRGR
ncbi:Metallo-dependent phosphatase [Daldinia bambusicola]|nr:Metallo-dependent phosphatase [Daldinia bambusicola]